MFASDECQRRVAKKRALELRKDIEKADYVALTSDRIARQSYVITGNKGPNSEFDKFSKQNKRL